MKFLLKLASMLCLLAAAATAVGYFLWYKPKYLPNKSSNIFIVKSNDDNKAELFRLQQKSSLLKNYLSKNHFNTHYCFMIDMSIASGKKRFFVYNLQNDSLEKA